MKASAKDMTKALLQYAATLPNREEFLREVQRELVREIGDAGKTLAVQIVTPSGDAGPLKAHLATMLEQKTGRMVEVSERADPAMIGGVIINFGDEQVDMSVRSSLEQAAVAFGSQAVTSHS